MPRLRRIAPAQARPLLRILLLWQRRLSAGAGREVLLRAIGKLDPVRLRLAVSLCLLLFSSLHASGAELFYMDHDPVTDQFVGPTGPLVISGEIIPGDADRLLSKILGDKNRFLAQNKILLASDGGDVAEALRMAKLIKSLYTRVLVLPLTGRCVSACFFIYAAANRREVDGERLVGINRPYLVASDGASTPAAASAMAEGSALVQVRAFLQENAVPGYLVDEMFRRASDDAYWLSADDEKNLGYRSPSFDRYLRAHCAWDDKIEREVYAGAKPVDALKQMLRCRDRVTQAAARKALDAAAKAH
jgi:hypothetical protein